MTVVTGTLNFNGDYEGAYAKVTLMGNPIFPDGITVPLVRTFDVTEAGALSMDLVANTLSTPESYYRFEVKSQSLDTLLQGYLLVPDVETIGLSEVYLADAPDPCSADNPVEDDECSCKMRLWELDVEDPANDYPRDDDGRISYGQTFEVRAGITDGEPTEVVVDGVTLYHGDIVYFYRQDTQLGPFFTVIHTTVNNGGGGGGATLPEGLLPGPVPALASIEALGGLEAVLAFGTSSPLATYTPHPNFDIDETYGPSGNELGIFATGDTVQGTLSTIPADPHGAYPANSFGPAMTGAVRLTLNGTTMLYVDLTNPGLVQDSSGGGSQMTVEAAQPLKWPDGSSYPDRHYRKGTFVIHPNDMRNGYNEIAVEHTEIGTLSTLKLIYDGNTDPLQFQAASLAAPVTAQHKVLSGVKYLNEVTWRYQGQVVNAYRNVYDGSAGALSFSSNGLAVQSRALLAPANAGAAVVLDEILEPKSGIRLLNQNITLSTNVSHPHKSNLVGGGAVGTGRVLLNTVPSDDTPTDIHFSSEDYRQIGTTNPIVNGYATQADVANGAWSSVNQLQVNPGYENGHLVYDGALRQPTQGLNGGDFRNTLQGNPAGPEVGPSNPDYSGLAYNGESIWRIENNTGKARSNFKLTIVGQGTFVELAANVSGQNLTLEMKMPESAVSQYSTGWLDCFSNFMYDMLDDGDGCRYESLGVGRSMNIPWGLTVGRAVVLPGECVLLRIRSHASWVGKIEQLLVEWD